MKILTVLGARPQFIKASVFSRELAKGGSDVDEVMVHTGQHFDEKMSEVFFKELGMKTPEYNLRINSLPQDAMIGAFVSALSEVVRIEHPDAVLVYGDTNSTVAGALSGYLNNIAVFHIEAGLRSFDRSMPEEKNRWLTDRLSAINFCPTQVAVDNLLAEGVDPSATALVGDIMYDSFLWASKHGFQTIPRLDPLIGDQVALCTIHRKFSLEKETNLRLIADQIEYLARDWSILLPAHPALNLALEKFGMRQRFDGICQLIEPLSYLETQYLLARVGLVVTDSGGLQKEAFIHRVFCITLRDHTEWPETVDHHGNRLVGLSLGKMQEAATNLPASVEFPIGLYGDGTSAQACLRAIESYAK